MSNYNQAQLSGTKWTRCPEIRITNPCGGDAIIHLAEETLATFEGITTRLGTGAFAFPFDPTHEIALRDPATGEEIGSTVSEASLYIALYSLYMEKALARDAQVLADLKATQEADEAAAAIAKE